MVQSLQKLISREPGDAAQIWFYIFLHVEKHCIDWQSKIVAAKQSKNVKNPRGVWCPVLVPKDKFFGVSLFADFLHFFTQPQSYFANQCSVQLPVKKHRTRFGLSCLVLEISIFEVSAPQVFDVIAFCLVSLPSTV